jgi:hypothetical protein
MRNWIIIVCVVLGLLGAAVSVFLWLYFFRPSATTPFSPDAFRDRINPDVFREKVSPESFKDGIGIYLFNNNQYNMLIWKKTLIGPRGVEEKDVMEAYQQAAIVKKGVRFFSYGMDISKWPVVPPYSMAFCIARDMKTIDGIFPIRIKPIDQTTYELIMPPQLDNMASGSLKYLFWAINFQYSCTDGWVFRFQ